MIFAGVWYSPSILERASWNRFARVPEERVHPVHMYLMHCRAGLQIRISERQESYVLHSGHREVLVPHRYRILLLGIDYPRELRHILVSTLFTMKDKQRTPSLDVSWQGFQKVFCRCQ